MLYTEGLDSQNTECDTTSNHPIHSWLLTAVSCALYPHQPHEQHEHRTHSPQPKVGLCNDSSKKLTTYNPKTKTHFCKAGSMGQENPQDVWYTILLQVLQETRHRLLGGPHRKAYSLRQHVGQVRQRRKPGLGGGGKSLLPPPKNGRPFRQRQQGSREKMVRQSIAMVSSAGGEPLSADATGGRADKKKHFEHWHGRRLPAGKKSQQCRANALPHVCANYQTQPKEKQCRSHLKNHCKLTSGPLTTFVH